MGQLIAVVSGKGGTGKTTFVSNVGIALARMGYKTLCLDCDIGLRNLDISLAMVGSIDFTDVMAGFYPLEDAVTPHPRVKNLYLLTAPHRVSPGGISTEGFQTLMESIRTQFDYCLLDAPAGLDLGFRLAVSSADRAIVVTTTDAASLRDAQRTVLELNRFPSGRVHLVVNRCRKKLLKSLHQTIDDAIDTAGLPLLGVVPEDETIPLYLGRGQPLMLTSNTCAAQAYRNIARRLRGERVSLMRLP